MKNFKVNVWVIITSQFYTIHHCLLCAGILITLENIGRNVLRSQ
jgi:hypothetical protein